MKKVRVNTLQKYEDVSDIYYITDTGEVYSEYLGRPISKRKTRATKKSKNRYYEVCLIHKHSRTKKTYVKIHRLVALAFIPNPNNYTQVNHLDQDGYNNNVKNLEWTTPKQNSRYTNAKKVYCYNMDGLEKVYKCGADTKLDGFNPAHVANVCRGVSSTPGRGNPALRHKNHVFSYVPMDQEEVVQRLSKKRNYQPDNRRVPKHYHKHN